MAVLKVYRIFNNLEEKYIFQSNSGGAYVEKVKAIAKENEDGDMEIDSVDQADAYILDYCENLDVE